MPVKKTHYKNDTPSPICRHPKAPIYCGYAPPPGPNTARGRRRANQTPEYLENVAKRKAQKNTANPSMPVHKGPRSRLKKEEMGSKQYKHAMEKRVHFDF